VLLADKVLIPTTELLQEAAAIAAGPAPADIRQETRATCSEVPSTAAAEPLALPYSLISMYTVHNSSIPLAPHPTVSHLASWMSNYYARIKIPQQPQLQLKALLAYSSATSNTKWHATATKQDNPPNY